MSAYVAVLAGHRDAVAVLGARCTAALRLAGAGQPVLHSAGPFAVAVARASTRAALRVDGDLVIAGDVRLDAVADLRLALRSTRSASASADGDGPGPPGRERADDHLALIAAAYAAWGTAAVDRLRGDFSFVLWDGGRQALLAVRDGLGLRPLYHGRTGDAFALSNVLNAVRAVPGIGAGLHGPAVRSFLHRGWNADLASTTFVSVGRLAPGTMLTTSPGVAPAVRRHWTMPDPEPLRLTRDKEYLARYRALLQAAVSDRLDDGTTLLFLSGGVDSTTIAAAAGASLHGDSRRRLHTVTMRATDVETAEESRLAASVAERLGLTHELIALPTDPRPGARPQTPEPYDDAEYAGYCEVLAALAAKAPVAFDGEDGDALFAPPSLAAMLRRYSAVGVLAQVASYTLRHRHHPYLGFWLARRVGLQRRPSHPEPGWLTSWARAIPLVPEPAPPVNRARPEAAARLASSLWQSVLDGADRAYHGAPIEVRWPLLDSRLIEFVFAAPPIPWCQHKHLARRAYAGQLPSEVVNRPKATIAGYVERLVAVWRGRAARGLPLLHDLTREYVDPAELACALEDRDPDVVAGGWRALQFDAWVRRAGMD